MKQGDEIWRLSVQFIGCRNYYYFLSMKFSNGGGSHQWELYFILSWHRDPPMILPNIILTCFRQWFSYFWHATLLKPKNVHALNPFVFVNSAWQYFLSQGGLISDRRWQRIRKSTNNASDNVCSDVCCLQGWQTSSASLCIQKVENIRLCMTKSYSANPRVKSSLSSPCLTFSPHPSSHASTVPWIISIGLTSI